MKIKKFFFNDPKIEDYYIKNGFLIIKNGIEKKFLNKIAKEILNQIKNIEKKSKKKLIIMMFQTQ